MNVFDRVIGAAPVVARQGDCQTCFMCELYCPEDALYVSLDTMSIEPVDEHALVDVLGSYRAAIGWDKPADHLRRNDQSYQLLAPG